MRIEDVAKLAGVSISTVSKIVNGKAQSIAPSTRERVMEIVRAYNYAPYSSAMQNGGARTFQLGLLSDTFDGLEELSEGLIRTTQGLNYNLIVCNSFGDTGAELKNITRLVRSRVDAVLWRTVREESKGLRSHFDRAHIPVWFLSSSGKADKEDLKIDLELAGYHATELLTQRGHTAVCFLTEEATPNDSSAYRGYIRNLQERNIAPLPGESLNNAEIGILLQNNTGFICLGRSAAQSIWRQATARNLQIPQDISIVALDSKEKRPDDLPELSRLILPWRTLGEQAATIMIAHLEGENVPPQSEAYCMLSGEGSIAAPVARRAGGIIVVGSLNMDITIHADEPLNTGVTISASSWNTAPGGKGLNQAVGAARLGGRVSLIGKVGRDYDGATLIGLLSEEQVNTGHVLFTEKHATGKAYVAVQQDGESSIVVYAGANMDLLPGDIEENAAAFDNSAYCLLPMEIPQETVYHAACLAKAYGAKLIVKPTNTTHVSNELLSMVDIFVPNRKEALALCWEGASLKEQADSFLKKGVGVVIITLGHNGCYLKTAETERYFDAIKVESLDTTGGADAFIAALATMLTENEPLELAVERANYAAGLSVTRAGVTSALVNRTTFEQYYERRLYR